MNKNALKALADRLDRIENLDMLAREDVMQAADYLRQCAEQRPCTCHPDDNPPVPCAQKYALNECRAASEPTETEIEARDALLDFISENGTASEGVQHYLDRYVRAALAAKEQPE